MKQSTFISLTITAIVTISIVILETEARSSPILLIPGLTGSQLDVQDGAPAPVLCRTDGEFVGLWVNEVRFVLDLADCISREMMLQYDSATNNYSAEAGVTVSVPGFGYTSTVEFLNTSTLDPVDPSALDYLHTFVDYFVQRGYVRGRNITAAPYDWRLAADQLEQRGYYSRLMSLVQTMYTENNNTKVTIVVHSMGGPVSLHFLTSGIVTQEWKNMYIANYITLSGAWSGGNEAVSAEISGIDPISDSGFFKYFRPTIGRYLANLIRPIIRSTQSTVWLLPRASVWNNKVLVHTPNRNYTANDYEALFTDIGQEQLFTMYNGIKDINPDFPPPNVPTYCFYGIGLPTPESFNYTESFPDGANADPQVTMGDGDGTVNLPSSEVCLQWGSSGFPFESGIFRGVSHGNMVKNETVLRTIGGIVGAPMDPLPLSPNKATSMSLSHIAVLMSLLLVRFLL